MTKKEGKPKLLCYGDSAISSTGFGQVFRNILSRLADDFDITQIAINHVNTRDKFGREIGHSMPFEMLDARYLSQEDVQAGKKPDLFGKYKLAQYIISNEFDIFFTIQDPLVVKDIIAFFHRDKVVAQRKKFGFKEPKTVYYFPVDSDFFPAEWMNIINKFDVAVPYTQYATDICKKADPKSELYPYILHGIDNKLFYRLPEKRRQEIRDSYGIKKDEWIIHSSNRNQPRKDPPRNLQIFKEFKKLVPKSRLVMHCDPEENFYNLRHSLKYFDLKEGKDVIFTGGKIGQQVLTVEKMNEIYNLADVGISTTVGEGLGLSTLEYFATQTPMILPDNTTARELIGEEEERGYLLKSGFDPSHWTIWPFCPKEPPRPLVDVNHAVELLHKVYKKRPTEKIEAAYKFAQAHSWDIIAEQWRELFKNIIKED